MEQEITEAKELIVSDDEERKSLKDLINFQPKQVEALRLADLHQYFLYGGSRGPGKSYWLRWYLLRELLKLKGEGVPHAVVGLFCEDYPALTDRQTSKIAAEFPSWLGVLKDSKVSGFGFHVKEEYGGGFLALRNLDDVSKYQSAEFAAIGVDELTKNPENVFDILRGSLRWKGVAKPKFVAATNPGGQGHVWVKRLWVDKNIPARLKSVEKEFCFLSALPTDNPYLSQGYWEMLETLPERLRLAWRYGDWNAFEGQFFPFNESEQLIDPFEIPKEWNLIGSLDPGYSSACSFSISAVDFTGTLYKVATYCETNRPPTENARGIREFIDNLKYTGGRMPRTIVADPSAWAKKDKFAMANSELSFADIMRQEGGLTLIKALNDRVTGWWALKDMMTRKEKRIIKGEEKEVYKYFVFKHFNKPYIDELNATIGDANNPEDIQGRGNDPAVSDHCLDEERYKIMAIYKPRQIQEDVRPQWLKELEKQSRLKTGNNFMAV